MSSSTGTAEVSVDEQWMVSVAELRGDQIVPAREPYVGTLLQCLAALQHEGLPPDCVFVQAIRMQYAPLVSAVGERLVESGAVPEGGVRVDLSMVEDLLDA